MKSIVGIKICSFGDWGLLVVAQLLCLSCSFAVFMRNKKVLMHAENPQEYLQKSKPLKKSKNFRKEDGILDVCQLYVRNWSRITRNRWRNDHESNFIDIRFYPGSSSSSSWFHRFIYFKFHNFSVYHCWSY